MDREQGHEFEELSELGFSQNEIKAYTVLVRFGKLSASEVSSKAHIPYGKVYSVLDSLISKSVIKTVPEKTKKFVAGDPEHLLKIIESKEKHLDRTKEKIEQLKLFYDTKEHNPVLVAEGKRAFYKVIKELSDAKEYVYSIKWSSEHRPDWERDYRARKKRGVKSKTLARYDSDTQKDVKKWLKVQKDIRKIENDGVAMSIRDDSEVMLSLIKSNVTLLIRDEPFAKVMRQLFEEFYHSAESIQ